MARRVAHVWRVLLALHELPQVALHIAVGRPAAHAVLGRRVLRAGGRVVLHLVGVAPAGLASLHAHTKSRDTGYTGPLSCPQRN